MHKWLFAASAAVVLCCPSWAVAAEGPVSLPLWTLTPFVALLLGIAFLPLFAPHFWHSNLCKAAVAVVCSVPVVLYLVLHEQATGEKTMVLLQHGLQDYAQFIALLAALYVVAGGIRIEGSWTPNALANTTILACGAVLANVIGTTGASMVLIRLFLRVNQGRQNKKHLPVFFIFIVGNLGGLLTPLGDPPLFLGFVKGIDFFWTLQLWPQWIFANGVVLGVFFFFETLALYREPRQITAATPEPVRLHGLVNLVFLAGILCAVLLQADKVAQPLTDFIRGFADCPNLLLTFPYPEFVMLGMALLSLLLTPRGLRQANQYTWHAIVEVAVLFIGIFVTMQPALALVERRGVELGITEPWQFFWLTGFLSLFLDNAPTYLTFATLAAAGKPLHTLQEMRGGILLQAVSCGAVFMGSMTYIGNGPNFMVKAIADDSGYETPSFFGYAVYSTLILVPVFLAITWLFFLP